MPNDDPVDPKNALLEEAQKALILTNERLKETNESLRSEAKINWWLPQIAFWVIVSLGLLRTLNETGLVSRVYELDTLVRDEIASNALSRRTLTKDSDALRKEMTDSLADQTRVQTLIFDVDADAHRVISLLNVAQDQLYLGKNPRRALVYLDEASDVIDTARAAIDSSSLKATVTSKMTPIVGELDTSVQSLKADCFLALADRGELKKVAEALICPDGKVCKNYEGHYFAGLVSLDEMNRTDDPAKIVSLRDRAAEQFRRSLQGVADRQQRHPALIFLAGLEVMRKDYRASRNAAEQFHESSDEPSDDVFLPSRIRTLGELASVWGAVADFIRGDESTLPNALTCSGRDTSITSFEAELLESLFHYVITERNVLLDGEGDDTAADMLGNYCASAIVFLRSSCGDEQSHCADCGSDDGGCAPEEEEPKSVMDQLRETYDLHPVQSVGAVSNDAAFGRIVGDRLLMAYWRMVPYEETRTYTVNVPVMETRERIVELPAAEGDSETKTMTFTVTIQTCRPEERTRIEKVWTAEMAPEFFDLARKDSLPRRCYIPLDADGPTEAPGVEAPAAPAEEIFDASPAAPAAPEA